MLRNDERWVVHMEASFRWSPPQAPNTFDAAELGKVLAAVVDTPQAFWYVDEKNKDEAVSLDDVAFYPPSRPEFLVLLFSYTNEKGADPGFKNLKTRKNRTEQKRANEAIAASAHLIIGLKQKTRKKYSYYPAIIEDVTGLGKTKMQNVITSIIHARKQFSFTDEDGSVRAALPKFEMTGLDDEKVNEDAANGRLSYFVAIRELKDRPPFDDSLAVNVMREEIRLKPRDGEIDSSNLKAKLAAIARIAKKKDYDKVQVHYVRKDGKNRSITFGTHREDAEDFLIKRIEKIALKTAVAQTHDEPCEELIKAMVSSLRK